MVAGNGCGYECECERGWELVEGLVDDRVRQAGLDMDADLGVGARRAWKRLRVGTVRRLGMKEK